MVERYPTHIDATRETQNVGKEQPLAGVRVLLVEDELDVATLLLLILEEAGAEIVWIMRASEALERLSQPRPDILISNIKLPDHDGDWLIQQIRQMEQGTADHLPAIALTSYTREFAAEKMLAAGYERFLPKNFDSEQLISTILDLL